MLITKFNNISIFEYFKTNEILLKKWQDSIYVNNCITRY